MKQCFILYILNESFEKMEVVVVVEEGHYILLF